MPGVNPVQPRVGGGLLDSVMKGLAVARDVYGIKHESDMADIAQQGADQRQTQFDDQQAGRMPQQEKVAASRFGSFAPAPDEGQPIPNGSVLQNYVGDQKPVVFTPFKDSQLVKSVDPKTGSPLWTWVSRGDASTPAYEPPREVKQPTPHFTTQADQAGNLWKTNTLTGEVTPVQGTDGAAFGKPAKPEVDPNALDPKAVASERKWLSDAFIKDGQRSVIGSIDTQIKGGEKLQTLLNAHPDGQLPPQFQSEVAMGLAKLVLGTNAPSQAEIEKLDPQTRGTFIANLWSKISDKPYSADNPEFIKLFGDTIEREIGTARDQYHQKVAQARYAVPNLFKAEPDSFFGIVGADARDFKSGQNNSFSYAPKMIGNKAGAAPGGGGFVGTANAAPTMAPTKSGYSPQTPKTVIQNGHTYTLNPETGQYE